MILAIILPLFHVLGVASAISAVMTARTSQGSIAWAISLITFPYLALPLYWVFGRDRFRGFVETLRVAREERREQLEAGLRQFRSFSHPLPADRAAALDALSKFSRVPWTQGNSLQVLIDGNATFQAIFDAIGRAKHYVLVQFFIIHDDSIGRELKSRLLARAREGVAVHLLYDEVGSHRLPRSYVDGLREGGVEVAPFNTRQGWRNRFQVNFRNHRKIVVVDGQIAFVGGHNVGDEYLGRSSRFGHWRDTHLSIVGPAVMAVQLSFAEDWYWATREIVQANWQAQAATESTDSSVLVLPTSPADPDDNCSMMFLAAINSAKTRLWMASPYFVPDEPVFESLKLAARRGVDVRVILPQNPDHLLVYLAGFDFIPDARRAGVRIFRYQNGFLHQKVFLVDDDFCAVGTANLDERSIRLNFEITTLVLDRRFAAEIETMLNRDLGNCHESHVHDLRSRGLAFRVAVRVARLLGPIL